MALELNPSGRQTDIGFAAVLVGAAAWAFAEAGNYPGFSGTFPRVLASLLAVAALAVLVRSLRAAEVEGGPRLFIHTGRFMMGAALLVLYIACVDLFGYVLPSLAIGVAVPLLLGFRDLKLTLVVTTGTVLMIIVVFVVLLGRPLPPDLFDPILDMLR